MHEESTQRKSAQQSPCEKLGAAEHICPIALQLLLPACAAFGAIRFEITGKATIDF